MLGASLVLLSTGCAPSALTSARAKLSAGQYADAREELLSLAANGKNLTPAERREVKDDLCTTDFMIGRPSLSFAEQRRTCENALVELGSQSGPILARIDAAQNEYDTERVESALKEGDLAGAEDAAIDYSASPQPDRAVLAKWSKRMWQIADSESQSTDPVAKRHVSEAISEARKNYPEVKGLDDAGFDQWISRTASSAGVSLLSGVNLKHTTIRVFVPRQNLNIVALNLDKFAKINDAMAARCGCDARTDVALSDTDFPLLSVRLDPENRRSELVILTHGLGGTSSVTMR